MATAGALIAKACGAEDAIIVNNCAAAVLLGLGGLAEGRDVAVSRSELVEIGGGFRIPDVMARSGANLIEVGTTNRTRVDDFRRRRRPGQRCRRCVAGPPVELHDRRFHRGAHDGPTRRAQRPARR